MAKLSTYEVDIKTNIEHGSIESPTNEEVLDAISGLIKLPENLRSYLYLSVFIYF